MSQQIPFDEALTQRLPLPLAQLLRRACNAKTPLERHLTAFSLWEASLKLLASVAIVEYRQRGQNDPELTETLRNLARPSLGHWWEFARRLLPVLAENDEGFQKLRDLLLGRSRDDLPRAAGLDAALVEALEGRSGARATVRCTELFDRLVNYRNKVLLGHAAPGQLKEDFHQRMAGTLLAGVAELLRRMDPLAGLCLLYVGEVRQTGGVWLVQRYDLGSENARRIEALELPRDEASRLPDGERLYLDGPTADAPLRPLLPLLLYDAEAEEVLFLNARRGRQRTEYLCYTTGRTVERSDQGSEQLLPPGEETPTEEPSGVSASTPGRRLGEFELLSELGRGGMGVVYRAWQPSLGRQVALKKVLHGGDARTEARFRREIRALGRVDHAHLVRVFTSGSDGEDWFYAMELVEGVPLSAVCDRLQTRAASVSSVDLRTWQEMLSTVCAEARRMEKPLSESAPPEPTHRKEEPSTEDPRPLPVGGRGYVRQVAELLRQVAEAAHELHEAGIVHRDIKPGNILVGADGSQAVLMDLGLAQLADDVEGRVTRTRQFVGTLRYASPEQVLAADRLDRRSDVYSLGATLWELLTLQPLFGATEKTPTPELMKKIQIEEPERVQRCNPLVPSDLSAIVEKCLQKDSRQRYATAQELASELAAFLAGKPVKARPVSGPERLWKWMRRRPAVAALLVLVALSLVSLAVGGTLFVWQADQARTSAEDHARSEAGLRQVAEQQKGVVEQQARDLKTALGQADRHLYIAHMNLFQREWEQANSEHALELLTRQRPATPQSHDLRGFEWRYWWHLCHSDLLALPGPSTVVYSLSFSPDGRHVAGTGSVSGLPQTLSVWDVASGKEAFGLKGHQDGVTRVAFSPDGRWIATAAYDKTVRLWDARDGQEAHRFSHAGVSCLLFSPDGQRLILAESEEKEFVRVTVRDVAGGDKRQSFRVSCPYLRACVIDPEGRRLALGGGSFADSQPGTLFLWDLEKGEKVFDLRGHGHAVVELAFRPGGHELAAACRDRTVRTWDIRTAQLLATLRGHTDDVRGLAYSPDGLVLASGQYGVIKLWDVRTGEELRTLRGDIDGYVAFSPEGHMLASGGHEEKRNGTIKLWDATGSQEQLSFRTPYLAWRLAFSPDRPVVASASRESTLGVDPRSGPRGRVEFWDTRTGQPVTPAPGSVPDVSCLAFSPGGDSLAIGAKGHTIQVWDMARGEIRSRWSEPHGDLDALAYSPDGNWLVSAGGGAGRGLIVVWDVRKGQKVHRLTEHTSYVRSIAFHPDGQWFASACWDRTVMVWDVVSGKRVQLLEPYGPSNEGGGNRYVDSVAFSRDGALLACGGDDGAVIWDTKTWKKLLSVPGQHVAFSPDSQRLATATWSLVRLWDVPTGQQLISFRAPPSWEVAFSPDGNMLASLGGETIHLWDASQPKAITDPGQRRTWEQRWRGWHQQQAREAEAAGQQFAARFHLDRLKAEPKP